MYSIPENIDSTEFSGWINQNVLLKESSSSGTSRKRRYELANVEIEEQCGDLRRRVLRPRHNVEPQSSPGASRTRPIRSNRERQRHIAASESPGVPATERSLEPPQPPALVTDTTSFSSTNDLSFIQALASYNWPQNYLSAHSDPNIIHRLQQPPYPHLSNLHLNQRLPHFDPWVLHNYLLASSSYSSMTGGHAPQETGHEDPSRNLSQLRYPSMVPDNNVNQNFIWQYPFLFNPLYSQVTRPPELGPVQSSHNSDSNPDLSYFFRPTNAHQREAPSNSNDTNRRTERAHPAMYQNELPLPNFNNHILPGPFSYGSLCPYHNTNHIIHHGQQPTHQMSNIGSNISETSVPNSFNTFPHPSELTFGHYWHQITPSMGPVNYPINSSNIDTLLHLAAHFEQRKRGITREELDKLPTHRFKIISEKAKKEKNSPDQPKAADSHKCLVCLDDFESKQSIRTLHCNHEFHAKCIDKWLKINRTCPLCRADAFDGTAQKDGS